VENAVEQWKAADEAASATSNRESERKESVAEHEHVPDMIRIRIRLEWYHWLVETVEFGAQNFIAFQNF
jgi:hypothetical protein